MTADKAQGTALERAPGHLFGLRRQAIMAAEVGMAFALGVALCALLCDEASGWGDMVQRAAK